jgi:hypothetical protein
LTGQPALPPEVTADAWRLIAAVLRGDTIHYTWSVTGLWNVTRALARIAAAEITARLRADGRSEADARAAGAAHAEQMMLALMLPGLGALGQQPPADGDP